MATDAIDFAAIDSSAEQPTEATFESQPTETATEQPQPEVQQTEQPLDGRRGPQNIRNSIKAASEALPEQAQAFKELGNAFFREQAYKQIFPTTQEAASAKQLIEGVGGVDGISTLQQRIQAVDLQDEGLKTGNPEVLDAMFKDFPEGAAALAPHYLERLSKVNPEAFSAAVVPYAIALLENAGFGNHLASILNETDPARAKSLLQQAVQWYNQQREGIKQFKPQAKNPEADKLKADQTKLQEEREQIFAEGVAAKVNASVNPEISKTVDQYVKQYKLNDTQKVHFQNTLQDRVVKEMNADPAYKKQVDLRKANKSRTHDTVASYISSEFNRRIKDAAFKVASEIYGAPKTGAQPTTGVVKAGTPKTAPSGGPLFVTQRPPDSQLDLSRPNAEMLLISGRAYTKDGRFVTWRK